MSISKFIIINSPQEFYEFLNNNSDLINDELKVFRDLFYLSKNGCPCTYEDNFTVSNNIYKNLENLDKSPLIILKERFGTEKIIFLSDGEKFFEY